MRSLDKVGLQAEQIFFLVERQRCDDQKVHLNHTRLFREHVGSDEELSNFPLVIGFGGQISTDLVCFFATELPLCISAP